MSLARLLYARAHVNLLDDPLSAVDAHVGAALFEQAIKGALAGTTRVLVTNALQYLPQARALSSTVFEKTRPSCCCCCCVRTRCAAVRPAPACRRVLP